MKPGVFLVTLSAFTALAAAGPIPSRRQATESAELVTRDLDQELAVRDQGDGAGDLEPRWAAATDTEGDDMVDGNGPAADDNAGPLERRASGGIIGSAKALMGGTKKNNLKKGSSPPSTKKPKKTPSNPPKPNPPKPNPPKPIASEGEMGFASGDLPPPNETSLMADDGLMPAPPNKGPTKVTPSVGEPPIDGLGPMPGDGSTSGDPLSGDLLSGGGPVPVPKKGKGSGAGGKTSKMVGGVLGGKKRKTT